MSGSVEFKTESTRADTWRRCSLRPPRRQLFKCRYIEYRLTNVLSLAVLMFATVRFALLSIYAPKRVHGAVGICGGSSTKLIDGIPTAVIKASNAYLKTDMEVGILSYAPSKDPKLELIAQVHWGNLKLNGARFLGVVTSHSLQSHRQLL